MKQLTLLSALFFTIQGFGQMYKIIDTSFTFTPAKFSTSVFQNDNSFDSYVFEIQNDKIVVKTENDENANSLKGYVFDINSIDVKALNEKAYVSRGVALRLKGKARIFSKYDNASTYTTADIILAFNNEEEKQKFKNQILDKKIELMEL